MSEATQTAPDTAALHQSHLATIARELAVNPRQAAATAELLDDGATVPFIARYRKEATGGLDEVAILAVRDRLRQLRELDARRAAIMKSLDERGLLADELKAKLEAAQTLSVLEDLYLPHRPKRRTRGMIAREKGLEPLADIILAQDVATDPEAEAAAFIDAEKGVEDAAAALAGARDIIAEQINESAEARAALRRLFAEKAVIGSRVASGREEDGAKYRDYFEWSEPAAQAPSHRVLAMRRGEREGFLVVKYEPPAAEAVQILERRFVSGVGPAAEQVAQAAADAYKRLLAPAMETELRLAVKKRAEAEAVKVFAENLRELLMASPLGQKRVLALDPGFRTGCKVACLDAQGALLTHDVIHILTDNQRREAAAKLADLVNKLAMEAIAVGNGTASRETEALCRSLGLGSQVPVVMVSESGASVYSASEVARKEFPDLDVSVRGAVSIGRRLMDPLAELVKIDPKAIGVGQYQHDVDQGQLKESLDDVVLSCVNAVGVEVNTASPELLAHVSGLGPALAQNIVAWREENGPFPDRDTLLKVPRLGPKAFEQAAGFLRVAKSPNPLDASAVHPESYGVVRAMAADLGADVAQLIADAKLRGGIEPERYVSDTVGLPTIRDILAELAKPGRDPREQFAPFSFRDDVSTPADLTEGMILPGIVTNVANFGAFVDVGVHQDGLVHISELADRFVKDPREVVKVADRVTVAVLGVDLARNRISLSMKKDALEGRRGRDMRDAPAPGDDRRGPGRDGAKTKPHGKPKGRAPQKAAAPPQPPQPKGVFNDAFARALEGLKEGKKK